MIYDDDDNNNNNNRLFFLLCVIKEKSCSQSKIRIRLLLSQNPPVIGDRQHIPVLCYFMPLAFHHIVQQLFAQRAEMQAVCNKVQLNRDASPRQSKL